VETTILLSVENEMAFGDALRIGFEDIMLLDILLRKINDSKVCRGVHETSNWTLTDD